MTYENYRMIFLIFAILSAVFAGAAIFIFFKLKIGNVIGDLTGRNAKKAIAQIRQQNIDGGNKAYKPSIVNRKRGKVTDRITPSGNLLQHGTSGTATMGTEKLHTDTLNKNEVSNTAVLGQDETTVLQAGQNEIDTAVFEVIEEITFIHTDEIID